MRVTEAEVAAAAGIRRQDVSRAELGWSRPNTLVSVLFGLNEVKRKRQEHLKPERRVGPWSVADVFSRLQDDLENRRPPQTDSRQTKR